MGYAPNKCPMCGETLRWVRVDTENRGFSVGKAAVGAIIFGPVGLVGGALGKRRATWCCGNCRFTHEYRG